MDSCGRRKRGDDDWLGIEEVPVSPLTGKKKKVAKLKAAASGRRWSSAVSATVLVLIVTTPPLLFLLSSRRLAAPVLWIRSTVASVGAQHTGDNRSYYDDRLLGGLLADGFDERSCHSRYQSAKYRRSRPGGQPSAYLVSKLRQQEALQRRCGPGTVAYSNALEQLRSGSSRSDGGDIIASPECKYLVSISYRGLGNRILAAASAFLYALLTERVLLVDPSNDMGELFCEPFPGTTWLLPSAGFPLASYTNFSVSTPESYGNMLRNKVLIIRTDAAARTTPPPVFSYVHLDHDATEQDRFFFCDGDQRVLRNIPWLVMRTDSYIVPGLFLVMGFQEELGRLFPEPDTVFHHVGRYLFHPSNHVWGLVTRYYDAYLATAQRRVGIQVRVFGAQPNSPELLEQITRCTHKEGLLPELLLPAAAAAADPQLVPEPSRKTTAVLVTSLKSWYYEKLKGMYWEHAAAATSGAGGEAVSVHQPSHEEFQRSGAKSHDAKAWAEVYLLSLTDALVTTAWSTFGYVAQGLGGLTPWVMYRPDNDTHVPDPPCGRDVSMDPCFHAPPFYDCRLKRGADTGKIVPQVQHCIDMTWGLKIVRRSRS